jgi:uncharacterized membrane protein
MIMTKILNYLVWPIILVPLVYLAVVWASLPETVAMHFKLDGTPDRFGSKNELITVVLILAAVSASVYLLVSNIYKIDPKRYAAENKTRLHRIAFAVAIFLTFINCLVIFSSAKGHMRFDARFVFGAIGLLWCIIGNYMYNIKPNYFAGIRLPWTLNNEENWRKTHLLAGKLWFIGGLLLALVCLLFPSTVATVSFITVSLVITIIPCIYSYLLYKKQKAIDLNN